MLLKTDSLLKLYLHSLAPTVGIMHQKESRGFCKPRLARTFSPCWHSLQRVAEGSALPQPALVSISASQLVSFLVAELLIC